MRVSPRGASVPRSSPSAVEAAPPSALRLRARPSRPVAALSRASRSNPRPRAARRRRARGTSIWDARALLLRRRRPPGPASPAQLRRPSRRRSRAMSRTPRAAWHSKGSRAPAGRARDRWNRRPAPRASARRSCAGRRARCPSRSHRDRPRGSRRATSSRPSHSPVSDDGVRHLPRIMVSDTIFS